MIGATSGTAVRDMTTTTTGDKMTITTNGREDATTITTSTTGIGTAIVAGETTIKVPQGAVNQIAIGRAAACCNAAIESKDEICQNQRITSCPVIAIKNHFGADLRAVESANQAEIMLASRHDAKRLDSGNEQQNNVNGNWRN